VYTAVIIPIKGVKSLIDLLVVNYYLDGDTDGCVDEDTVDFRSIHMFSSLLLTDFFEGEYDDNDGEMHPGIEMILGDIADQIVEWFEGHPVKLSSLKHIVTLPDDTDHIGLFLKGVSKS
jgi:hypothetical protein|tara:strand:- start:5521 stop:5877 length:357 start_codon:yes stop_codon:yes gene_type:complete